MKKCDECYTCIHKNHCPAKNFDRVLRSMRIKALGCLVSIEEVSPVAGIEIDVSQDIDSKLLEPLEKYRLN